MYIAEHEDGIIEKFKNKQSYRATSLFTVVVFILTFIIPYVSEAILNTDLLIVRFFFGTISSCSFIVIMLCFLWSYRTENYFTRYVGTLFAEIYLFHGIIIDLYRYYCPVMFGQVNCIFISLIILISVVFSASAIKKIEVFFIYRKR